MGLIDPYAPFADALLTTLAVVGDPASFPMIVFSVHQTVPDGETDPIAVGVMELWIGFKTLSDGADYQVGTLTTDESFVVTMHIPDSWRYSDLEPWIERATSAGWTISIENMPDVPWTWHDPSLVPPA